MTVNKGEVLELLLGPAWEPATTGLACRPLGYSRKRRRVIWPVDELLARYKCKRHVAERLKRLNPEGVEEGSYPRGWHRKGPAWAWPLERNYYPLGAIVREHGRAVLDRIPRESVVKDGRRKFVPHYVLVDDGIRV